MTSVAHQVAVARPRVKICGIRRREDAELAVALGADAIGVVFWPRSPRAIDPATARQITAALPPFVAAVGVFVNETPGRVIEIAKSAGLTAIQLHGDEDPAEYVEAGLPIVKAVAVGPGFTADVLARVSERVTVLLDAHDPIRRGGTGTTVDWSAASEAARVRRVILSGGLSPKNVREAIEAVRPFAVDVSSGVEAAPGVKDESMMRDFFRAVHS